MSTTDICAQILNTTLKGNPLDLLLSSFYIKTTWTDSTALRMDINAKILQLKCATICNTLFIEVCPSYSNQPHAMLDHIQ
jgi:hypothetical protein